MAVARQVLERGHQVAQLGAQFMKGSLVRYSVLKGLRFAR
jgi:hypothetical protein